MNSRHSPAFCRFFACALTFWALCTGAPAYAVPLPAGAEIEISRLDGSTNCFDSYMHYRITGLAINTIYGIKFDVVVQQQGGANGVYSDYAVASPKSNDSGVIENKFTLGSFSKPNHLCADLQNAPFTISLRAGADPNYNEIATPPMVVSGWGGTPTVTSLNEPSSATISASGNACADASLHIVLEGLTANAGYIFSALDVVLEQGSSTGTLQLTDWMVTADGAGRYEGDVPLSSFSPASGITCADLAAGTPFDVKLTATLPGGAAVDGTTQYAFPPYTITVDKVAGGTVTCDPTVPTYGGSADCRVTPDTAAGYTFDRLDIVDDPAGTATLGTCSTSTPITCPISNVTGNVTVKGVFKQAQPQPQQPRVISDTPTMGDVGLLLSGLALAGAAVPALRRREKQGKKADTSR